MSPRKARRTKGEGTIYYDKARKLWVGQVDLGVKLDGTRDRPRRTAKDKADLLRKLNALKHNVDNGLPIVSETETVRGWCEHYVAYAAPKKSRADYVRVLTDYVYPYPIAGQRLAKLEPEHVRRWVAQLERRTSRYGEPLKPATIAKARTVLGAALSVAVNDGKLVRNVVHLTKAPKLPRRTSDAMTVDEVDAVLACSRAGIPTYRPGTNTPTGETRTDRLYALAVLVLAVGVRQAEALDLRWSDVDLKARTLDVYVGRDEQAKTDASVRTIPLPAFVVEALKAHRVAQRVEQLAAPIWADGDLVFPSTIGTRMGSRNALRWWHALTTRAGVGRRRFHASRHTAATVMLNRGVPLEVVSAILGHASLAITADIYAKPNLDTMRAGADAIDRAYAAGNG